MNRDRVQEAFNAVNRLDVARRLSRALRYRGYGRISGETCARIIERLA